MFFTFINMRDYVWFCIFLKRIITVDVCVCVWVMTITHGVWWHHRLISVHKQNTHVPSGMCVCVCPQIMRWCQCFPCDLCALDSDDITHRVHDTLLKAKHVISYIPNVQWQQRIQPFFGSLCETCKTSFLLGCNFPLSISDHVWLKKTNPSVRPPLPGPLHRSFSNSRRPAVFSISTVWSTQRYLKHELLQEW